MHGNLDNDNTMDKDKDKNNKTIQDKGELFVGVGAGGHADWC